MADLPILDRVRDDDNSKRWDAVDFVPGRRFQSAEANDMQSLAEYYLKQQGLAIHVEGDVIDGCLATVDGNAITITDGRMFIRGKVRPISGTTTPLTLRGAGVETVGVRVTEVIVTEINDPDLLDPVEGWANASQPGAYRRKVMLDWVANVPTTLTIFTLVDGNIQAQPLPPEVSTLARTLARRTYNQSGHYLVHRIIATISDSDTNFVYMSIPPLSAVVQGYEVVRLTGYKVKLPIARDTLTIKNEPHTYLTAGPQYQALTTLPVAGVSEVDGTAETLQSITRGALPNGIDTLPSQYWSVITILEVKQGITTFSENIDYVKNGNSIDWSPGGVEPGVNTTYTARWTYTKTFVKAQRDLVFVSQETATRALVGDEDNIKLVGSDIPDVEKIIKITDNAGQLDDPTQVPYIAGIDYVLWSDPDVAFSQVHWNTGGGLNRPVGGATYYIRYRYWAHTIEGDYIARDSYLTTALVGVLPGHVRGVVGGTNSTVAPHDRISRADKIDWRTTGTHPIDNTTYNVDYTFYLDKWYVTSLDSKGNVNIISGVSDAINPTIPQVPENELPLERIFAPADSTGMSITEYDIVAVHMDRLNALIKRVDRADYNSAIDSLNSQGENKNTTLAKRGVFTDAFITRLMMDPFGSNTGISAIIPDDEFDVAIAPRRGELILPREFQYPSWNAPLQPSLTSNDVLNLALNTKIAIWESVVTLKYVTYTIVQQIYKTDTRIVNKAVRFIQPVAAVTLEPHEDLWTDYSINSDITAMEDKILYTDQNNPDSNMIVQGIKATSEVSQSSQPAEYVRQRTVNFFGKGFANNDIVTAYFADVRVDMTPILGFATAGPIDLPGTITAEPDGTWGGQFTVPPNIPAGAITVAGYGVSGQNAAAVYRAFGSTVLFTITTVIQDNDTLCPPPPNAIPLSLNESVHIVDATPPAAPAFCTIHIIAVNDATGQQIVVPGRIDDFSDINTTVIKFIGTPADYQIAFDKRAGVVPLEWKIGGTGAHPLYINWVGLDGVYMGHGLSEVIVSGDTPSHTVTFHYNINPDPVLQTMTFDTDVVIKSIKIQFHEKPIDGSPVVVKFIGGQQHFLDISTILGRSRLTPSDIAVDDWTEFAFPDPILAYAGIQYAFMVATQSPDYTLWVATQGQFDFSYDPPRLVGLNPFINGVFEYSTDGRDWTIQQNTDITFQIIGCQFTETHGTYTYNNIAFAPPIQRIALKASQAVPTYTTVDWNYSIGGNVYGLDLEYENVLGQSVTNLGLDFNLTTSNALVSPLVSYKSLYMEGITNSLVGNYYTLNHVVDTIDQFTVIELWITVDKLEFSAPSKVITLMPFYSVDAIPGPPTWVEFGPPTAWRELDNTFVEYYWTATVSTSTQIKIYLHYEAGGATTIGPRPNGDPVQERRIKNFICVVSGVGL